MNFDFLFYVFFVGLVIALIQDIKRREVDDWLNLVLIFFGWAYISFKVLFDKNVELFFLATGIFILCFFLVVLFFQARVFGGGDAKLLLAMFSIFVVSNFVNSFFNVLFFVVLLMFSGAVYGLIYLVVLFLINFKKVKKEIVSGIKNVYVRILFFVAIFFGLLFFVNYLFLLLALFTLLGVFLFVVGKSMEKVIMIKEVKVSDLREGDLLSEDLKFGKRILKSDWNGLSDKDINFLKKHKKKVKIKDGLPFVPSFVIAFILYYLFENWFVNWRIFF